jgi:ankyrin repeat protein
MQVRINVTLSTAVCVGDDVVVELVIVAVALHGILSLGQDEFYACFGENGSITTLRLLKAVCRRWQKEARCVLCNPIWQAKNYKTEQLLLMGCPDAGVLRRIRRHEKEASIANKKDGRTPLHLAALSGREAVVKALLVVDSSIAMKPDTKDMNHSHGRLPLHFAVFAGKARPPPSASLIQLLVSVAPRSVCSYDRYTGHDDDSGRYPSSGIRGRLPLHYALIGGAPLEVVRILISSPAEAQSPATAWDGVRGRQALHTAAVHRASAPVIRALIEASPRSPRLFDGMNGHEVEYLSIAHDVFEFCDEPDDCKLPLHLAVCAGCDHGALEALIDAYEGALRIPDGRGRLPIHLSVLVKAPSAETVSLLLSYWPESARQPGTEGAGIEPYDACKSPLELARRRKAPPDVMRALTTAAQFEGPELSFDSPYSLGLTNEQLQAFESLTYEQLQAIERLERERLEQLA